MFKTIFIIGIFLVTVGVGLWLREMAPSEIISLPTPKPTPLAIYSIENLRQRTYGGNEIKLEKVIKEEPEFTSYIFSFTSDDKRVTGQADIPLRLRSGQAKFPVIVMLRGYADREIYFTGLGTRKAAGKFAKAGFITLAPDFLGFGGSDDESSDILGARFEKPITVINLLKSIENLPNAEAENIFLWGHSNGGQIATAVLEITKKPIPTTLWAPVTRGFPDSVLDYIGEMDDQGRMVAASISAFLATYDPNHFSVTTYFGDINAPLQVHQGTGDSLVKLEWTGEFIQKMKKMNKQITYYIYPRDDHNLSRNWDTIVDRDIEFFRKHMR